MIINPGSAKKVLLLLIAFMLGVIFSEAYASVNYLERPFPLFQEAGVDRASPHDRIREDQIKVYSDHVLIKVDNPQWASFADTKSMDPVIDKGANAIQIVPQSKEEIHVGDIISYNSDYASGVIIHRVIHIGYDEEGWYCIAKGDNNPRQDPGKIRFSQIRRVLVAIIY